MNMKLTRLIAAAAFVLTTAAGAQTSAADPAAHPPASAASATVMTDGEVRKIDREQGKVTLRHGPITNLDMPGMTMVFRVADPKMLDTIEEGDKVKFTADKVNGVFTVTIIQPAK